MTENFLEDLFNLLKKNKALPNYQAERRIDIFINYFIERILSSYLEKETIFVCPEFPLKKATTNQSTKLDYLCKTKNEIVFVELKTDVSSLKKEQADTYLKSSWTKCLTDLKIIFAAVKNKGHREKYNVLITTIHTIELTEENTPLRIIYISPLPNEKSEFFKAISISYPKHLKEIEFELNEEEQVVWNYLTGLGLYIFEIKN